MILKVVVLLCMVEISSSLPKGRFWRDDTITSKHVKFWDGKSYSFGFQTLLGISRKEKGYLKKDADGRDYMDVEGEYSYVSADGAYRKVTYRANREGYHESEVKIINAHNNAQIINKEIKQNIQQNIFTANYNAMIETKMKAKTSAQPFLIIFPSNTDVTNKFSTVPNRQSIGTNIKSGNQTQSDAIFFPGNMEQIHKTTESPVLTTDHIPANVSTLINETLDYYYDELGNRIGGVPPSVLGSLLG